MTLCNFCSNFSICDIAFSFLLQNRHMCQCLKVLPIFSHHKITYSIHMDNKLIQLAKNINKFIATRVQSNFELINTQLTQHHSKQPKRNHILVQLTSTKIIKYTVTQYTVHVYSYAVSKIQHLNFNTNSFSCVLYTLPAQKISYYIVLPRNIMQPVFISL